MDQREIRKKMAVSETHNNTLGGHERAAYSKRGGGGGGNRKVLPFIVSL